MSRNVFLISLGAILALGCGSNSSTGGNSTPTTTTVLTSVVISSTSSSLPVGEYAQLSASARDQNGQPMNAVLAWTSSDASIATVSASGVIVALKQGAATITAAASGHSGSLVLTVTPSRIASLTLSPIGAQFRQGDSLRVALSARDAAQNVISNVAPVWSSNNSALVAVDQGGMVRAARNTGVGGGIVGINASVGGASANFSASIADWSRNVLVDAETQKPYTSLSIPSRVGTAVMFLRCYQGNLLFYFTSSGAAIADGQIGYRFSGSNNVQATWPLTNFQVLSAPDVATAKSIASSVASADTVFLTWHPVPSGTQTAWFLSRNLGDYLPSLLTECP